MASSNPLIDNLLTYWPYYASAVLLLACLLVVVISFVLAAKRDSDYRAMVQDQSNSVRIFVVDVQKDLVSYFNVTDLRHVRTMSLGDFYRQFPQNDQTKVINWINQIADPKAQAPTYLETDVTIKQSKKNYFSMLQVDRVDPKTGKIHLQSYLLKYMTIEKGGSLKGLASAKELEDAIASSSKNKGITYCFRFVYKKAIDKDKEIDPLLFNQIKNVFFPYLAPKKFLLEASRNELVFSDLRASGHPQGLYLAHTILNSITRFLSLGSLTGSLDVRIGVVENSNFPGDGDSIIKQARETALIAYNDNDPISWYEKGRVSEAALTESSYRTEVERIISEKKLSYSFRPIFSVTKMKVIGYLAKATPIDTYFDSIDELKDYAIRTEDDKDLFATIAKNLIPRFVNEKVEATDSLFYPARMAERSYMLTTFARLGKAKDAHIVFLFSESDVRNHIDLNDPGALLTDIRSIKAKGYEIALLLNESDLMLTPNLYSAFDYFLVSFLSAGSATGIDTRIRSELHVLVEKLLRYNKPIIASDMEGWNAIELLVRSGLNYISSDSFAPYDQMIMPISNKAVRKIQDMKG